MGGNAAGGPAFPFAIWPAHLGMHRAAGAHHPGVGDFGPLAQIAPTQHVQAFEEMFRQVRPRPHVGAGAATRHAGAGGMREHLCRRHDLLRRHIGAGGDIFGGEGCDGLPHRLDAPDVAGNVTGAELRIVPALAQDDMDQPGEQAGILARAELQVDIGL